MTRDEPWRNDGRGHQTVRLATSDFLKIIALLLAMGGPLLGAAFAVWGELSALHTSVNAMGQRISRLEGHEDGARTKP